MLWLQPAAWLGLVVVAAPLLIHLLVHRRSEPLAFPTLQFLQPTRFASIRRHRLDDLALLIVRAAALAAVAAAFAGPLLTTAARRASWNTRVARVVVVDSGGPGSSERVELARAQAAGAFRFTIIEANAAADGMRRAVAWLADVPLARREIVCVSPLAAGSVTAADVAAVPDEIGLRFVRSGSLPPSRSVAAAMLTSPAASALAGGSAVAGFAATLRARTITLTQARTSVADAADGSNAVLPIDVTASPNDRRFVEAAVAAVLSQRAAAPAPGRRARLVIGGAPEEAHVLEGAVAIHTPWIGDAAAALARDDRVASIGRATHARKSAASANPSIWLTIATDTDGVPVVAAAQSGDQLLFASAAPADDMLTPVLIESILDALLLPIDRRGAEIVPIADAQLHAWQRPAGPAALPDPKRPIDQVNDDRRWLWGVALCLLAIEWWMRGRSRDVARGGAEAAPEVDRVA